MLSIIRNESGAIQSWKKKNPWHLERELFWKANSATCIILIQTVFHLRDTLSSPITPCGRLRGHCPRTRFGHCEMPRSVVHFIFATPWRHSMRLCATEHHGVSVTARPARESEGAVGGCGREMPPSGDFDPFHSASPGLGISRIVWILSFKQSVNPSPFATLCWDSCHFRLEQWPEILPQPVHTVPYRPPTVIPVQGKTHLHPSLRGFLWDGEPPILIPSMFWLNSDEKNI